MDYINQFRNAMINHGLNSNAQLIPDGQLHRIHIEEDSPNTTNGWYVLYGDGIPSGAYGCWKRGISENWCSKIKSEMTPHEWNQHLNKITQAKEKQSQAKIEAREKAYVTANRIWNESNPANDNHPYLLNKGVKSYNLRLSHKGSLIVPLYNNDDQLISLQFIAPNGKKLFLRDGSLKGNYFLIGSITDTFT